MASVREATSPVARAMVRHFRMPAWVWLAGVPALYLLVVFVFPTIQLLSYSVMVERPEQEAAAQLTLRHYAELVTEPLYQSVIVRTLKIGLLVTVLDLIVSYPIALAIVRARSGVLRAFLVFTVLSPLLTSIIVRTYGWMIILSDRGPINRLLMAIGITETPYRMLYNEFGVTVALVQVFVPFMVLSLTSSLQAIDPSLQEAAQSLRANRMQTFLRVTLPLSMPGIVTGSILVFILTIGAYVTPQLLGGAKTMMMAVLIQEQILGLFNWSFAAAVAGLLLLITLVILGIYLRLVRRWAL